MNICIIATYTIEHLLGGREIHIKDLAEGLEKRGHSVTILTTKHPEGIEYENKNGIDIYYYHKSNPILYRTTHYKDFISFFQGINQKKDFDIVHDQATLLGISFIKYSKLPIPTVSTFHGTTYDEVKSCLNVICSKVDIMKKLKSLLVIFQQIYSYILFLPYTKRFDAVIATSDEQVGVIEKYERIKRDKIYKVFNGVDTETFKPSPNATIRKKYGLEKSKIILTVSKLEEQKGIQNIIRAMPKILKELKDVILMVVGDGNYMKELKKLVSKLNLGKYIIFTGTVPYENLPDYFNTCAVFVNPTIRQDGYDLTIIEAMACAKPVVVSNIGSVPSVMKHNVDGILIPPSDINALSNEVIRALNNKELANRISEAAREKTVKEFSLDNMVEGTIKVYKDVIKKYKSRERD